jgi:eukaryotic-like serine/threonine-protein kinase
MSNHASDRNLLVGILALQMDFISQPALIAAMQAWMLEKTTRLEDLLLSQGVINADTRDFLVGITDQHLKLHKGKVEESLASLSTVGSLAPKLVEIDAEFEKTLSGAHSARLGNDSHATKKVDVDDPTTLSVYSSKSGNKRFQVIRPHAQGGLGVVSVARDNELHRDVAMKEIQGKYTSDLASRNRFVTEAEVTGQLEHPGIVPVYSLGQSESGQPFYVMRFVRGDSLKTAINRLHKSEMSNDEKNLAIRKLVGRLVDVCNAIEYAHSRGVLHRDLKPGNIMLGKYGETLVVDWGLAKTVGRDGKYGDSEERTVVASSGDGSTETRMGSVVGTLAYMSPEQAEGRLSDLGPAADVYCLGATLYCILVGKPPVKSAPHSEMIEAIRTGDVPNPASLVRGVDPGLVAICRKAMSVKMSDRYNSVAAMGEDLELWLADEPIGAYREPVFKKAVRWVRRHQMAAGVGASLLIAATVSMMVINALIATSNRKMSIANDEIRQQAEKILEGQQRLTQTRDDFREVALRVLYAAETELSSVPNTEPFRTKMMEQSLESLKRLQAVNPEDQQLANQVARSARIAANQKARTYDAKGAIDRMQFSIDLQKEWMDRASDRDAARIELATTFNELTSIHRKVGNIDGAIASLEEAESLLEGASEETKKSIDQKRAEGVFYLTAVGIYDELDEVEKAFENAIKSSDRMREVLESNEANVKDRMSYPLAVARRGSLLDATNQYDAARTVFAAGLEFARAALDQYPTNSSFQYGYSRLLHWDAEGIWKAAQVTEEVKSQIMEAVKMSLVLHQSYPTREGFQYNYGDALRTEGNIKATLEDPTAIDSFDVAVDVLQKLVATNPTPSHWGVLADSLIARGEYFGSKKETQKAKEDFQAAIAAFDKALESLPNDPKALRKKSEVVTRLGEIQ